MTPLELLEKVRAGTEVEAHREDTGVLHIELKKEKLADAMVFLRQKLSFDWMSHMTALDRPESGVIEAVYELFSNETKDRCVVRVKLDRASAVLPSVCAIYRTAEWHEREAAEMFGIKLQGHPDPRRLLTIEGMNAPLRKDFTDPDMKKLPV